MENICYLLVGFFLGFIYCLYLDGRVLKRYLDNLEALKFRNAELEFLRKKKLEADEFLNAIFEEQEKAGVILD